VVYRGERRREVKMALVKSVKNGSGAVARRPNDLFESFFADWPTMLRRPFMVVPEWTETMKADEFTEDDTLVVRVEMAGIDPESDIEISLDDDVLHIGAERHQEDETKERSYVRRELRYGSFRRDLLVPKGTTENDVKASYKDGILEVRVPMTPRTPLPPAAKIPVAKS
jgi:HSP20 family protein